MCNLICDTFLGRMWEHWAWTMSVLFMSTQVLGQCYKSREVGGILKDATRLTRQINVEAMRNEILIRGIELVESIPHCKSITTSDGQTPLCVVRDLATCMKFGGEMKLDELELYNSVENEWREHIFPSDLILAKDFCYLTINAKPIIHKKETCYAMVDVIKGEIGIASNFADHRLVIQDKSLTGVQDDVLGQSLCHQTAYLLAEKQSDLILLRKLGQAFDKITEIIKMVGLTIRNYECGNVNFGHFTTDQILCFKRELQGPTRSKRSTLLNLLLGDGARTDTIQNKVHDMTSVINDNSLKLYHNQEQLKLVSLSNGNSIIELEKRSLFSEAVTLASIHHIEKSLQRQLQNELSFMSNNGLFEEITEAQLEISVFAAILSQVLLQEKQFCTSLNTGFGCIQLNDSFVRVKGQVINLDLKVRYLEKTDFYLISCQPRMSDSTISIFHNNHAKIQANHLQIKEFLISEEHLKLDKEEHRSITHSDYYLENILFTNDENKIGLTCRKPELLFTSGNRRFNCTPVITWLSLSEGLEIHSVRGSITHSETRQPHLTKKSQFLQNYETLDGNVDNLEIIENTNKTGTFWLERLNKLTPIETAAVSLGSGAAILITLFFLICIWKINFQCCRSKQPGVPNTTERNHPSREEVLQRSQSILEGYLDRLRRGSTTRPQPEQ